MHERLRVLIGVSLLLAGWPAAGFGGPLTPATFNEYVGIALWGVSGPSPALPEVVNLTVDSADFAHRGGGHGSAAAGGILPVTAETRLHLYGDTNGSGIGGTTSIETKYQFMIQALQPAPSQLIDLTFSASGSVTVDSNQPVGSTFARLTSPFGHFEAKNYDAYGWYTGTFGFDVNTAGQLWSERPYDLTLYVYSHGQGSGLGYYFDSHAFLDPTITITPDPGGGAAKYTVVFSPGIEAPAGPAVPEPASLWLMATGLAAVGARVARRRR